MQLRKYRWSKVYESAEEELLELFKTKRIQAQYWTGEDGEEITKRYEQDTQLWCAEGLLSYTIGDKKYSLQPGDALDIPAESVCTIRVGFGGCSTYESQVTSPSI
jgi:quercetin dioxygenase-like cupin family protein